ncbi:flagella basal body P-ring formation protein FlgA [Alcanivorax sp. N3-2A]|nr:flagella basal body P-ring formation protein FlgA [Alcanivorax sp. N3-2A]
MNLHRPEDRDAMAPCLQRCIRFLPMLVLMAGAPALASAPALAETVRAFLEQAAARPGEQVRVTVAAPDVAFTTCQNPRPFLPGHGQRLQGRVSVGIRCGEHGRVRYLQARVSVIGEYWVTRRALDAGEVIGAGMLERKQGDLSELPRHAIRDPDRALGQVLTRPLAANSVLSDRQLRQRNLVSRRQNVSVVASGKGFRIAREGEALQDGALGERIRIRMNNRQTLTATVTGRGQVAVDY